MAGEKIRWWYAGSPVSRAAVIVTLRRDCLARIRISSMQCLVELSGTPGLDLESRECCLLFFSWKIWKPLHALREPAVLIESSRRSSAGVLRRVLEVTLGPNSVQSSGIPCTEEKMVIYWRQQKMFPPTSAHNERDRGVSTTRRVCF
jgi:hypothetical protein